MIAAELYPEDDATWLLVADPRYPDSPRVERIQKTKRQLKQVSDFVRRGELTPLAQQAVLEVCSEIVAVLWRFCCDARVLILAPHGPLHYLPIAAAPCPVGVPLMEAVITTTLPSSSFLRLVSSQSDFSLSTCGGVTVVCGPDYENDSVLEHLGANILKRLENLYNAFKLEFTGTAKGIRPGSAAVVLAHGRSGLNSSHTGELLMRDIGGRDFWCGGEELAARLGSPGLVFLAVCRSSTSRVRADDEPLGLAWPMLAAGSNAVIASLWDAEPRSTAFLVGRFFDGILEGSNAGSALAGAVSAQRRHPSFADFRDWGCFHLYGDWRWRLNLP